MRDEFSQRVKDILARRVGVMCSNPSCRQPTSGPRDDPEKTVNVGVAAHIAAAIAGGPRYDIAMSSREHRSASNGIWLCQKCAKLIDDDPARYTVANLTEWKRTAEESAHREIEARRSSRHGNPGDDRFARPERLIPDLLAEVQGETRRHLTNRWNLYE
jgi:hypothetical protein